MIDGLVVTVGALALVTAGSWAGAHGLGVAVQRMARAYPDEALPPLRAFVHRGCEFDQRKYLQFRLKMARRRLAAAHQTCRYFRTAIAALDQRPLAEVAPLRRRA